MTHRMSLFINLSILLVGVFLFPLHTFAKEGTVDVKNNVKTYTIKKGDTLWDISETFLDNPFQWPSLWRRNPYIRNPHLIYPGDMVRITPEGIEIIRKRTVDIGGVPDGLPVERLVTEAVTIEPNLSEAEKIWIEAPLTEISGFITKDDYKTSGILVQPMEEKMLIAKNDLVFTRFEAGADVAVGDQFTIIEVKDSIRHPVTGKEFGFMTEKLGVLKIRALGDIVEALIEISYKEILTGARLIPFEPLTREVIVEQAEKTVQGVVVTTGGKKIRVAKYDIAYIDKGTNDGLTLGNMVIIYREMGWVDDPLSKKGDIKLPSIDLGKAILLDVKDNSATAFIIESTRPMQRGDLIRTVVE